MVDSIERTEADSPFDPVYDGLGEVARGLAAARDVPDVLSRIASLGMEALDAEASYLERIDREREEVEIVATAGAAIAAVGSRIPYPGSLTEDAVENDRLEVVSPDDMALRRSGRLIGASGCRDCFAVVLPLVFEGVPLGALILLRSPPLPDLTSEESERIRALAGLATLAFRRALDAEEIRLRTAATEQSERRFRLLVESVQDYAIYMLDPEGRVSSWNQGAERLTGYREDEVAGRHVSILYTPEDRARGRPAEVLDRVRRVGRVEERGWRIRSDGSRFWAGVVVTAILDSGGGLIGFAKVTRDLTERMRADAALRESEERFIQLTENAREVFWLMDARTFELVYVSAGYRRVWGRDVEELMRDPNSWIEAVHPEDREIAKRFTERLVEGEAEILYRIHHPSGETRWLHTRGFPVREPTTGEVIRVGGVSDDVTHHREAEDRVRFLAEVARELGSSLDYAETLTKVARLVVPRIADWCVVDVLEGERIERLSVAHVDPEREALAWDVARRFPSDPQGSGGVAEVLRSGRSQLYAEIPDEQLRQVARDEEHLAILKQLGLCSAMIVPMTARGRTLGAVSFIAAESGRRFEASDLEFAEEVAARASLAVDNARLFAEVAEARGEAERRAREEAALRRATEAVTGSTSIDEVIHQIAVNSLRATNADGAFVQRIQAEDEEVEVVVVSGRTVPRVGARAPYPGSYVELVVEGGAPVLIPDVASADRSDADTVMAACGECSALIVPLLDAEEAIGALVLTRLPRRQGFRPDEAQRARTFADLATLAFRRIHLLEDSERRREELEEVTESRGRLIRGFAHDLKNPLGAADGYVALLEDDVLGPISAKQKETLTRVRRLIGSSLEIISHLVELHRAEAGQIPIEWAPVVLRDAVREITEAYRGQATSKGLVVAASVDEDLPVIESDASRVRQVLGNLLSNAVKYTESGEVLVSASLRNGDGDRVAAGLWVAIDVTDTGPGIPADKQHLLFREFTRLDPEATHGAGLGLAISQRIASALGGCITMESEAGRGSTFTLWLPGRSA